MGYLYSSRQNIGNMLQLTRFSVYLEGILNKNKSYFYIKNNIVSAALLLARTYVTCSRACSLKKIEKNRTVFIKFSL